MEYVIGPASATHFSHPDILENAHYEFSDEKFQILSNFYLRMWLNNLTTIRLDGGLCVPCNSGIIYLHNYYSSSYNSWTQNCLFFFCL